MAPPDQLPALKFEDPDEYNIAVHIRTGDTNLPKDPAFLKNIKLQLDTLLKGYRCHYYIIAENPKATKENPYPPGAEYLRDIFNDDTPVTFLNDLDPKSTLFHLMNGDMMILSGSGMAEVAATLAWKPVIIHAPNKSGEQGVFKDEEWVWADSAGKIYHPTTSWEIRSKIAIKYYLYRGKTAPFRR